MDRRSLARFTHSLDSLLTLDSNLYKQWVFRYTFLELEKDLGTKGDITTNALFKSNKTAKACIISKEKGILSGISEIRYFLLDSDSSFKPNIKGQFNVNFMKNDGDALKPGEKIMEIEGNIRDLLAIERVTLNLLMRMSGVSTFTAKVIEKIKSNDILIVPTRKTLWGLLDKRAVFVGGGGTHRLNLADSILIKDNHLDLINRNIKEAFKRISEADAQCRFIEIEVDNKKEALTAAEEFVRLLNRGKIQSVGVILLDNMKPQEIKSTIDELKKIDLYDQLLFEASGGITIDNAKDFANTGVDLLSMGQLTQGVKSLDFSMEVESI